jgi:hypothetical protein
MKARLLRQLERVKVLFFKEDKVVINSWDITYHENLKKYEKKKVRFVEEDTDEARPLTHEQRISATPALRKRRSTLVDKRKTDIEASSISQVGPASSGTVLTPSMARRMHAIVIEDS